jgi:AraC-like DNA-binding protein
MIMVYGGVLLLIILATVFLSYRGTVGGLKQQLKGSNGALLKQIDQKLEMAFQQVDKDLLQFTNELEFVYFMNDSYTDGDQEYLNLFALNTKLSNFMYKYPHFSSIFVYSHVSGHILTEQAFMNQEYSENKWITQYLDMKPYFKWLPTHQIWDGSVNRDVVTLIRSYPALSAPGFRRGLLAVNMNEAELQRMIRDIYEEGYKGHTFIIDDNGQVITHDDKEKLYSSMKELPYITQVLSGPDNGSFNVDLDGEKQTVFYRTSSYTGWRIVSVLPQSQVFKPLIVTRNLLIACAAIMSLLGLAVTFLISRRTFGPIDLLVGKLSGKYKGLQENRGGAPSARGVSYLENVFDQMFLDREQLEKQVREYKPMLKWRTVMDLLMGYQTDISTVGAHLEWTGCRLFPEWFVVSMAEISKEGGIIPQDEKLYTYALCNVAEEIIQMENAGVAIDLGEGVAAIVFSFPGGDEEQNHLKAATLMEHILDVMSRQIGVTVTAGVGKCYRELKHISLSYEESRQALQYKMVLGRQTVISIEDLQAPDNQDYYRMMEAINQILDALKLGQGSRMTALLHEAFIEAVRRNLPPDLIRQFSLELIMRSMQTLETMGIRTEPILIPFGNLHERIQQCENWQEIEELVCMLLDRLQALGEEKRSHRGKNDTLERVLVYIREHYHNRDLSLDYLGEHFHLNPTYISRLFKDHAEGSFIDYLIKIRIEASKELLKDWSLKISDISDAVGYANSRSFLRTFKKMTGLTPSEYREQLERS